MKKKKEKKVTRAQRFYLSAENSAYVDGVLYKSYNYTLNAILECVCALGAPLDIGGLGLSRQEGIAKTVNLSADLLLRLKKIKVGSMPATLSALVDSARKMGLKIWDNYPLTQADSASKSSTDGASLTEGDAALPPIE